MREPILAGNANGQSHIPVLVAAAPDIVASVWIWQANGRRCGALHSMGCSGLSCCSQWLLLENPPGLGQHQLEKRFGRRPDACHTVKPGQLIPPSLREDSPESNICGPPTTIGGFT